ncbi:MAG: tRNA (adenosine(37)-N6)-threonylcarbamoyltransferase complex ATPase subunit type 1 TsaE [Firmicutes bacterium HGW-Firmicutes-5]|nr:MAG: tRNA (adenosine(37)-N6)-threonylcarbamoyltransferase complex ATPase subunit type 1 TsaE [Firmicutes bacterium HGW-Firmicutes-5]
MNKKIYESTTEAETQAIGEKLGMEAKQGEVYCLDGELGVGKTVFTKGFAKGLHIHEHVTSPTFTILNLYESGRLHFYHFDVYRLSDPYELEEIGYEDYFYGQGVTMVEWASRIEELIPKEARYITIEKDLSKGLDYRTITIEEGD